MAEVLLGLVVVLVVLAALGLAALVLLVVELRKRGTRGSLLK